jgi:hypothetical protein
VRRHREPAAGEADVEGVLPLNAGHDDVAETLRLRYEVDRLQAENTRLIDARRELDQALEQRTRRVDQLLGVRDQLRQQLAAAQASLQELNRELGAAGGGRRVAAATTPIWQSLGDSLRQLVGRLPHEPRLQREPASPRVVQVLDAEPTREGPAPLVPFAAEGIARPVVAVVAFGLTSEQRVAVLDMVARHSAERNVVPLILTDDDDFAPLRSRRMVFEYFPPPSVREALAPALEWELYLQRRLSLVRRKWQPVRIIPFGQTAAHIARLWQASPFEDPDIARLFGAEPAAPPAS